MLDGAASLTDAYAACEQMAREHYENFPVASWLLPAAMRPHVAAVYAFARTADDIADEGTAAPEVRCRRLAEWQARLHAAAVNGQDAGAAATSGAPSGDRDKRILMAVGHSVRTLDLPIAWFDDLVSAFGQDIMTTRYASWREVGDYCRRSANPVGRLVLRIAGYRDEALERSSDALCTALQLTNFWQDLGRDWRIGRLYVPAETMRTAGASEETLTGPRLTEAWANAIAECAAVTRERFAEGRLVCDGVRGRLRAELRLTWLGGMRILERVERGRYALLHQRPALGPADVPRLLWQAILLARRRPAVVMARKTSFYYSFLVLPAEQRRAIVAVWDFCRAVDDAVDETPAEGGETPTGRAAVSFWRDELARCFEGREARTRQAERLQPFVQAFNLPRSAFEDVIDGVAMDLDTTRYETFADLYEYCRRVASAVGMICIQIFGCRSPLAREYALNLGLALQLTNILRDISGDLERGRLYLPLEDLRAFGCSIDALAAGIVTGPVRNLMAYECRRARDFYRRAEDARPPEDRHRLVAAEIMRAVYYETLNRIELVGYDVFSTKVRPPRFTQAIIALNQWLWRF